MEAIEIWKDISGYEGYYQVSNLGNVKSLGNTKDRKERILKPKSGANGRYRVNLCVNNQRKDSLIHQLVAIAFLNHKPCGFDIVVDHINNNKSDNRLVNLQLITQRENSNKDRKGESSKYRGVTWDKKANRWLSQIQINGKKVYLGRFKNESEASQAYQNKLATLN
jgi:NUMOD4 motif./AP2 domain./HNH endonuclease.